MGFLRILKRVCDQMSRRTLCGLPTFETADINFRHTTLDDYQDVVSLRKHSYNGMDYLPSEYRDLLRYNTGIAGFVGRSMVSFMFATVIDDGQCVLLRSGRVKEGYEGLGILTHMKKHCYGNLPDSVKRSVIASTSPDARHLVQQKGARGVFQRNVTILRTTTQSFKDTTSHLTLSSLETVDARHLEKIFLSNLVSSILFPENRFVVKRVPYRLITSNINHIFRSNIKMFASHKDDELFMSASHTHVCEAGLMMFLDFYGNIDNIDNVAKHVTRHLRYFVKTSEMNLVLYVTYGSQQRSEQMTRLLSNSSWEVTETEVLYGIEKTI